MKLQRCSVCLGYLLGHPTLKMMKKCPTCGLTVEIKKMTDSNGVDWTNEYSLITPHFSVHEALYLPTWKRLATEEDGLTDEIKANIVKSCLIFEKVRDLLSCPMTIHSLYRPPAYSKLVGGSETDVHTQGLAVDFDCNKYIITDKIKQILMPQLEQLGLRMEDNGEHSSWIHIDTHAVVRARFFKA